MSFAIEDRVLKCNMSAEIETCADEQTMWHVVRVYGDVFKHRGKKSFAANGASLMFKRDHMNHMITFTIPKLYSAEEATKEDLVFNYFNFDNIKKQRDIHLEMFKSRNITFNEMTALIEHYKLPDLTAFEIKKNGEEPFFSGFVNYQSPETRVIGIVYKTIDDNGVCADGVDLAYFVMDLYSNCVVEHKHKSAFSCDADEY